MKRVDQATVKVLELTAPWASTLDAQKLRGKVLGGDVFPAFNQPEREEIWNRLQSFKGLVPSLYGFFEDIKLLEAWANCLKWVVHLGARDTVSSALRKTYTGANQATGSALVQETETTFNPVPADLAYQMDLGCRQLWAFAMRYHREIPKKPSDKNLLARPTPMVDTRKLREMADLANRLGFESSEITALKQHPNSTDSSAVTGNNRPILVTAGPGETRKERCGMPHIQSYQDDRKFVFIPHLHDDRNEQSEGITSFFRLRSVYSNFCGTSGNAPGIQDHPRLEQRHDLGGVTSPAPHMSSSEYSPRQGQTREPEHMNSDGGENEREQAEDTVMHEGELEEQRSLLQPQEVLAQETIMQEQQREKLLFDANMLEKQKQEQELYRQNLLWVAGTLQEQEQEQEQRRQKLLSQAHLLEKQEQEQEQYRQKLAKDASAIKQQEKEQGQQRQKLLSNVNTLEGDAGTLQEQEQQRQKLLPDANTSGKQEQEQEQYRQKLAKDANALKEQEQEQERRRQKLISDASTLTEREQEQEQMYQKLTADADASREQERRREEQRQTLAMEETQLMSRKRKQEEQQQTLAEIAGELMNQEQRQEEQRQKLAECASDLKNQELRQNEQRQKLTTDINKLNKQEKRYKKLKDKLKKKREQKKVEQKVLGSKQDESGTIQERDERDTGELQRRGQEELADLELPSTSELEHDGVYNDQSTSEVRAEKYSMNVLQKGGTQVDVSASKGENSPTQDDEPQEDRAREDGAQVKGQYERQKEESQRDRLYDAEAQERGHEHAVQNREHEHQTQEEGQEDRAHEGVYEDAVPDDKVQGSTQADEAQEAVQEDKAHKDGQDGGVSEDDVRRYGAQKRRVMTEESDDGAALRAQQIREGRKPVEKGKYQRLNRFGSLNHDVSPEGDTSVDGAGEGNNAPMQREKPQTPRWQQRQNLQAQQRATNATAASIRNNTNGSTDFTSDFTFEAPPTPSRGT